jgi:hypothetical protein
LQQIIFNKILNVVILMGMGFVGGVGLGLGLLLPSGSEFRIFKV